MAPAIPIFGVISAVVGAGAAIYGAVSSANAARAAAKTQAQYARYNMIVASQNATAQAAKARLAAKRQIGSQRAAYAASGLDPDSGSPLLVTLDQALEGELAAQTAIRQGIIEGTGYQAGIDQTAQQAKSASTAAYIGGVSNLMDVGNTYMQNKALSTPRNTTLISGQDLIG